MGTAAKIYAGLGGIVAVFAIISGLWVTADIFATDIEVAAVKSAALAATAVLEQKHDRDQVSAAEGRKNDRVDRIDRDITKQLRLIEFGDISARELTFEQAVLKNLAQKRQNIIEGKE